QLIDDAIIARSELRRSDQDLEGAVNVDELLLTLLRHAKQEFQALGGIFQRREFAFSDIEQLLPAARRLIERLEDLTDTQHLGTGRELVLECAEGALVLRRRRHDYAVDFDRSQDVAKLFLLQLPQAMLAAQDLVGRVAELGLRDQD